MAIDLTIAAPSILINYIPVVVAVVLACDRTDPDDFRRHVLFTGLKGTP